MTNNDERKEFESTVSWHKNQTVHLFKLLQVVCVWISLVVVFAEIETDRRSNMPKVWVSVTGLELKSWLRYPQFMMYAAPSFIQAQSSPGNVFTDAKDIGTIHHTLTVWEEPSSYARIFTSRRTCQGNENIKDGWKYGKCVWIRE